jgi:hypothetical protein
LAGVFGGSEPEAFCEHVDTVIAEWAGERPDLDMRAFAVVGRIGRAGHLSMPAVERKLAAHGSTGPGRDVELRPAGKRLVDKVIAEHLDDERRLIAGLSRTEQRELAALLRRPVAGPEPEERHASGLAPSARTDQSRREWPMR